jgi:anti-sigma regulatory factor (Ser/Thr protein kinase)
MRWQRIGSLILVSAAGRGVGRAKQDVALEPRPVPRFRGHGRTPHTDTQLKLELPHIPEAPGIARRWLGECFDRQRTASELASAKLLTSELVTNAVVHGRGGIVLSAWLDADHLHVEVGDQGKRFVRAIRERDVGRVGGWGLAILDAEATRWGIGEEATTHVWFELDRMAPNVGEVLSVSWSAPSHR